MCRDTEMRSGIFMELKEFRYMRGCKMLGRMVPNKTVVVNKSHISERLCKSW